MKKEEYICRLFGAVLGFRHKKYATSMDFDGKVQELDVNIWEKGTYESVAIFYFYIDRLNNKQILKIVNYIEYVLDELKEKDSIEEIIYKYLYKKGTDFIDIDKLLKERK